MKRGTRAMKITLLLFAGVLLQNCNKHKTVTVHVNSDLTAAFNYKPGTYWIYKDSLSGRIDSFAVMQNGIYTDMISDGYNSEGIVILISEYNVRPSPLVSRIHHWKLNFETSEFCLTDVDYLSITGGLVFAPLIIYPYQDPYSGFLYSNTLADTSFRRILLGDYSFNNFLFGNSCEIKCKRDDIVYVNDIFYLSPDVGLFKMNIDQPSDSLNYVWELQNFRIVK